MKEKYCTRCKTDQDISNFHKDKYKPDGLCSRCKTCKSELGVIAKKKRNAEKVLVKKNKLPKGKILCERNNTVIFKTACILDCNDACRTCKSRQESNIKAGGDTLTAEEETIMRHEGIIGGGMGRMIEETISWGEL